MKQPDEVLLALVRQWIAKADLQSLPPSFEEEQSLRPFGVEIRYPGDFPELLPGQEQTVVDLARRTGEGIMAALEPSGARPRASPSVAISSHG